MKKCNNRKIEAPEFKAHSLIVRQDYAALYKFSINEIIFCLMHITLKLKDYLCSRIYKMEVKAKFAVFPHNTLHK